MQPRQGFVKRLVIGYSAKIKSIFLSIFLVLIVEASAVEYVASGEMAYKAFKPDGNILFESVFSFEANFKDRKWLFKTTPHMGGTIKQYEMGEHEQELYLLTTLNLDNTSESEPASGSNPQIPGLNIAHALEPTEAKPHNAAVAEIFGKNVPPPAPHFIHPLWLAFCSADFLRDNAAKGLPRFWIAPSVSLTFEPTTKWKLSETDPLHPLFIKSFNNGSTPFYSNGTRRDKTYDPPYDKGFKDAEFIVNATTNVNGLTLPKEFVLNRYRPMREGKTKEDLRLLTSVSAVVYDVRTQCPLTEFRPEITVPTSVTDYRVSSGGSIEEPEGLKYLLQPGAWREVEAVKASDEYRFKALRDQNVASQPIYKKPIFIAFLALNLLVFFFVLRSKSKNETSTN